MVYCNLVFEDKGKGTSENNLPTCDNSITYSLRNHHGCCGGIENDH